MFDVILFTPFNAGKNHGRATVSQLEILNLTHQQYY